MNNEQPPPDTAEDAKDEEVLLRSGKISTPKLRREVVVDIVQPSVLVDLRDSLYWRYRWRRIAGFCYFNREIFAATGIILTYIASAVDDPKVATRLAIIAGSIGTMSTIWSGFASYCRNEAKRKTAQANQILGEIQVDKVSELLSILTPN